MPFELIMLMGFFGAALLALLPAAPARAAGERLPRRSPARRRDKETHQAGCSGHKTARLAARRAGAPEMQLKPGRCAGNRP